MSASFGPAGGTLLGPVGSTVGGIEVTIPAGALATFAEVTLSGADPLPIERARPAGPAFSLIARPDPGLLQKDVMIRLPVDLPPLREVRDLIVIASRREIDFAGNAGALHFAPVHRTGELSRDRRFLEIASRRFGECQAFLADSPRRLEDAAALVADGLEQLATGAPSTVRRAGLLFRQALEADPWSNEARFYEAVARLALLLSDRADTSAAIDSVGELVESLGLRLGSRTLFEMLLADAWPRRVLVPPNAPSQVAVLDFLTTVVCPEVSAIRDGLMAVGDHLVARVKTGDLSYAPQQERELDFGELAALRALLDSIEFGTELLASYDIDAAYAELARDSQTLTLEELLAKHPNIGRTRASRTREAASALARAVTHVIEGYESIAAETDDQNDDVLVFHPSITDRERAAMLEGLENFRTSLLEEAGVTFRISGQSGSVLVRLRQFLSGGPFDLRAMLPPVRAYLPVADALPDPTVGGLFPHMTREEAIQRAALATTAKLAEASIAIDGETGDWPAQSEVLVPADEAGDAHGSLPAIDGTRLFLATDGTLAYMRLDLALDNPGFRANVATIYALHGEDLTRRPGLSGVFELRIDTSEPQPTAELHIGGEPPVPAAVALGQRTLEVGFPLDALGARDAPAVRVLHFTTHALDRRTGATGHDASRRVLVDL